MRVLLIALAACLTAVTFYVAERQTSDSTAAATAQRAALETELAEIKSRAAEATTSQGADLALQTEIDTLNQTVETLSSERDGLVEELAQSQASIDAKSAELDAVSGQNATLQQEVDAAATRVAELNDALSNAAPGDSEEVVTALGVQLEERDAALIDLRASVTELTTDLTARDQATENLTTQLSSVEAQVESLSGVVAERDTLISSLEGQLASVGSSDQAVDTQVAALTADLAARDQATEELASQLSGFETQVASLTGVVAERDTLISSLEGQLADVGSSEQATGAEIATLTADLEAREQAAEELASQLSGSAEQIESLTGVVAERDTLISSLEGQLADASETGQAAGAQIAALTATLEEKDANIASLQAAAAALAVAAPQEVIVAEAEATEDTSQSANPTEGLAQQCVARAGAILAEAPITFDAGTSTFSEGSVATIEQLGVLAVDCQSDDLIIEIGAHTDSQGPGAKNQTLSEERAQTVFDYMAQLGVAPANMRATGFGETQPIESNGTIAGRAANRRITLEWLQK